MLCIRRPYPPSPPTSTSPVPPHVGQSPLPPQAEQADSCSKTMTASEIFAPRALLLPWQTEQLPSPEESQSRQVWVVTLHLPNRGGDSDLVSRHGQDKTYGGGANFEGLDGRKAPTAEQIDAVRKHEAFSFPMGWFSTKTLLGENTKLGFVMSIKSKSKKAGRLLEVLILGGRPHTIKQHSVPQAASTVRLWELVGVCGAFG